MISNRLRSALVLCAIAGGTSLVPTLGVAQSCVPTIPKADLISEGKLMLSTNPTLRPLQYVDSSGELKGMNIDLANELAKRLCLKADLVRMDFPAMIPALKAGRFDGINTGMFFTEERAKLMWAVPYAMSAIDIVAAPGSKVSLASADAISGVSVGVETDSYQERWLREREKDNVAKGRKSIKILAFPTASDVMAALRAGQFDIAAFPSYAGNAFVKNGQAVMVLPEQGGSPTMMSFRSKSVADAVVKAYNDMMKDGTYDRILDQYGMTKLPARVVAIRGPGPQ
ncbi:ABC transporter substrate-binding protein [Caenimonas soli]|uniref:ABC transporter substrate-binding protein n=1 Tax=Caenimonas soli TaxID=2735555 RepID=UPI001557B649|nr:ABC transporter substrate-binding protein [Caenimonas soli]NPC55966.1 ABC transporter substrate-binding protein [Caenimonas soli]